MASLEKARQKAARKPGHWVEWERVAPIIEEWVENHRKSHDSNGRRGHIFGKQVRTGAAEMPSAGAMSTLAFRTGLSQRSIYRILEAEHHYVSLDKLDKLLTGMDLTYLINWPPEQGGFSDVYFHESVVGRAA